MAISYQWQNRCLVVIQILCPPHLLQSSDYRDAARFCSLLGTRSWLFDNCFVLLSQDLSVFLPLIGRYMYKSCRCKSSWWWQFTSLVDTGGCVTWHRRRTSRRQNLGGAKIAFWHLAMENIWFTLLVQIRLFGMMCSLPSGRVCPMTLAGGPQDRWRHIKFEVYLHSGPVVTVAGSTGYLERPGSFARANWIAHLKKSSFRLVGCGVDDLRLRHGSCCVLDQQSVGLVKIIEVGPGRPCQLL